MKLVLDTNIYSDYAEGLPAVVEFLAIHGDDIFLPSIVLGELSYGFMKASRQRFNERKLQEFIRKLQIDIIDVNRHRRLVEPAVAVVHLHVERQAGRRRR